MYSKITISGSICSGKSTLVFDLHQKLGWPLFSTSQLFRQESKRLGLSLEEASEQNTKLTKDIDGQIITQLLSHKNIIVEGWMGGIMAQAISDVLKVLLTANDTIRFGRFAKREQITLEEAAKRVVQREQNWFSKMSQIYGQADFFDRKYYDLVIDTSAISQAQVLEQVLTRLNI